MIISSAIQSDVPALCVLLSELFSQEAEFEPDAAAQSLGLMNIICDPQSGKILVARHQDQVLGMVSLLYTISTALGGRVALLEDLIVSKHARKQGIGSLLIEKAINIAKENSCLRITLLTDHNNVAAQLFYEKHGFKISTMQPFRLILTGQ